MLATPGGHRWEEMVNFSCAMTYHNPLKTTIWLLLETNTASQHHLLLYSLEITMRTNDTLALQKRHSARKMVLHEQPRLSRYSTITYVPFMTSILPLILR